MGRNFLIALCVAVGLCAVTTSAADLTIAKDGASDYTISISPNNVPSERLAAVEIAKYIKRMSGAELSITAPNAGPSIIIACRWEPSKNDATNAPEQDEFEIRREGDSINISGTTDRAILHAAYVFLEGIGCRFLAPELNVYKGAAEIIPKSATITVPDSVYRTTQRPVLKFRKIYVEEGHSHTPENLAQIVEWMPKAGYNTLVVPTNYQGAGRVKWDNFREKVTPECQKRGITIEVGGHGYQNFINAEMEDGKLFEQHPDYFAVNAKGERQKGHNWVFNTSNPDAVDYLIHNFVAYIQAHPEIQIYDFWPPDGAKWCECDACKKLGTPSDRQAILVQKVKEQVAKVNPKLRLEVLAYHTSIEPPEHVKLDPSILLDFCPINQQFDHQINDPAAQKNADYVKSLLAWRKAFQGDISIYSYYRKYAWDSLPVIIPHYMQKDLQWYATVPVQGISTYAEPADWCTYELNHYVLARLAWNPNCDVDALIKQFCDARYGQFAAEAQKALGDLEDIARNTSSIPNTTLRSVEQIEAALTRARKLEQDTRSRAQGIDDPAIKSAINRLALMCQYLRMDLEVQKLRASSASKQDIQAKADAIHQFVGDHASDGVFLVKDQRLSTIRMNRRYGVKP